MRLLSIVAVFLIYFTRPGQSSIFVAPRDAEALVGTSTHFNCKLSNGSAGSPHWDHYRVGAEPHQKNVVYAHGTFYPPYRGRFMLENDTSGMYTLIIPSVANEDAGRYVCQHPIETRNKNSSELIVIEAAPNCSFNKPNDGVIGPNDCDIEPENLHLSCKVKFHGNKPPSMTWKKSGDDKPIVTGLTNGTLHGSFTYNLTITADLSMQGSYFVCQTTQSRTTQHSCITDIIRVLYVFSSNLTQQKTIGDNVICYANSSSQRCNYTWKRTEDGVEEFNEQVLPATTPGRYSCEAHCQIREVNCTVKTMEVDLASDGQSGALHIFKWVGIAALIAIVLIFLIICIVKLKRKRNTTHGTNCSERWKVIHKLKTKAASRESKEISGATALNQELFVITIQSRDIEVYCLSSFKRRRTLKLDGNFGDISSCSEEKRLYLMNWVEREQPNEIISVTARGRNKRTWSTENNGGCLSVTSNCNVLLTEYWNNKLIEYSPHGEMLREIVLTTDISHPRHAVQLETGNFIVCHGDSEGQFHRVCIVDDNGNIDPRNSYGRLRGSATSLLDSPKYVAVNKLGMIFVSEAGNGRVTILTSDFEYFDEICPAKGQGGELKCPTRIYLDDINGRLIVADNEKMANGQVTVFALLWLSDVVTSIQRTSCL